MGGVSWPWVCFFRASAFPSLTLSKCIVTFLLLWPKTTYRTKCLFWLVTPEFIVSRKTWQQAAGARSWTVTYLHTGSQESIWEVGQGYKFSKPVPSNILPPAHLKGSITSPNWRSVVQIHESMVGRGHFLFKPLRDLERRHSALPEWLSRLTFVPLFCQSL